MTSQSEVITLCAPSRLQLHSQIQIFLSMNPGFQQVNKEEFFIKDWKICQTFSKVGFKRRRSKIVNRCEFKN